jgi:hypothetical protein
MFRSAVADLVELGIGTRRPNLLLPAFFGALARAGGGKSADPLSEQAGKFLSEYPQEAGHAERVVAWYDALSPKVKRRVSGRQWDVLYAGEGGPEGLGEIYAATIRQALAVHDWLKLYKNVPTLYAGRSSPGLQLDPLAGGQQRTYYVPPPRLAETDDAGSDRSCCPPPETPRGEVPAPGADLASQRYAWELGPAIYCDNPEDDSLGDDLYAVAAWGDGNGHVGMQRVPDDAKYGPEDMDHGEHANWPYPARVVYPFANPGGYLHVEVDLWEHDGTLDFFRGLLGFLSDIAEAAGAAAAAALGGPEAVEVGVLIGGLVGDALESARSSIHAEDDDDLLGTLVFDYPEGEADLEMFVGPGSVPLHGRGVDYTLDYVVRRA